MPRLSMSGASSRRRVEGTWCPLSPRKRTLSGAAIEESAAPQRATTQTRRRKEERMAVRETLRKRRAGVAGRLTLPERKRCAHESWRKKNEFFHSAKWARLPRLICVDERQL